MTESVVAAHAPILAAVTYFVFLVVPDQTAEVIRSTFETRLLWLIPILFFWWLLNFYLIFAFYSATWIALADLLRDRGDEGLALDRTQLGVLYVVTLSPVAALWIALGTSLYPNVLAALTSQPAIEFLLATTIVGLAFAVSAKHYAHKENRLEKSVRIFLPSAAILMGLMLAVLRIISFVFGKIADPPPVLNFTAWTIILLAILMGLAHLSKRWGVPVISMLVIWALLLAASDRSDNHVLRTLGASAAEPQEVGATFDAWIKDRAAEVKEYRDSKRNYPVFLVAAEGGGSRAAYMTALVLEALRKHCPDAIRHTFLMVGVSGGSVGALLESAAVNWDEAKLGDGCDGRLEKTGPDTTATNAAGVDFLRPLLRGLLFGDIPARFFPSSVFSSVTPYVASITDPAQFLETGIDRAWREFDESKERDQHKLSSTRFSDLWVGPSSKAPALVLLTTDVASGRRVAVSHLTIRTATKKPVPEGSCVQQDPNEELVSRVRLLTLDDLEPRIDVSAATAAVLSARFPGITAAGRLPCSGPAQRLVDGGSFENSGLTTVLELRGELRTRPSAADVSFVIVQIENNRASSDWSLANGTVPSPPDSLPELMSPVRAITGTRQARGDLARVALMKAVPNAAECRPDACDYRLLFELRPCKRPIPLGWSLSEEARDEIRRQLFDPSAKGDEEACVPADRRPPVTGVPNVMTFEQIFHATKPN